ncbi:MAG: hypothetical protein ACRDL7_01155 [Gaiellaceae bacterium]
MLTRAMPSLASNNSNQRDENIHQKECSHLQLPAGWIVKTISEYNDLSNFVTDLKYTIDLSGDSNIFLGFDVEWDSLTENDRRNSKPEVLQLATSDGKFIAVLQLQKVFGNVQRTEQMDRWNCLTSLFMHSKVKLCGVGIKADITRLMAHWPEGLFGLGLREKVFDAGQNGIKHNVVGRGEGSLGKLTMKFFNQRLDKVRVVQQKQNACQLFSVSNIHWAT